MLAKELISKAKVQLVMTEPFWATLALNMEYIEDSNIPTMCTNGEYIKYNPKFTESLPLEEVKGVLAHEVCHPMLMHHLRRGSRNPKKWNRAADYALNPIVIDAGFKLPSGALINPAFKGMTAEQIYDLIPDEPEDNQPGQGEGMGGVEDSPAKDEAERHQKEQDIKQVLSQAKNIAKKQGKLPGGLERLIDELLEPVVDWREVLARFLSEPERNDYTFRKPNSRYLHSGFYLPSLYNESIGNIVFVRDSSASVDDELVKEITTEIQDVSSLFKKSFLVMDVDTQVQQVVEIEPDGDISEILKVKGRGGTSFVPPYKYLEENGIQPAALVYLTDGECNNFPKEPEYPTLWMIYSNDSFSPPFGEVVKVK